jgi:hypothetical protein
MRSLLIPYIKTSAIYSVELKDGRPFFDTQAIAGNATKGSLTPNRWANINGISDPIVKIVEKKGDHLNAPGRFVDVLQLMESQSTQPDRAILAELAKEQGYLTEKRIFTVNYSDKDVPEKETMRSSHSTWKDAMSVAFGDESLITTTNALVGTYLLIKRLGITEEMAIANGEVHAAVALLEDFSKSWLNIDGIIWNERYANKSASATFMSVFPSREQNWKSHEAPMPEFDQNPAQPKTVSHRYPMPHKPFVQKVAPISLSM